MRPAGIASPSSDPRDPASPPVISAGELLGEPDDHVVVQAYLRPFAERALTLAGTPAVGDVAASCVHPLRRAVLVEQADGNAQRRDAAVSGSLLGRVHQQRGDAAPPPRLAHRDLVDQRDAAAAESRVIGLPDDGDVTDGVATARGDKADPVWFQMPGQVPPRLGLAVTDPLAEKPDGRLGITLTDELDGDAGKFHDATLAYAAWFAQATLRITGQVSWARTEPGCGPGTDPAAWDQP